MENLTIGQLAKSANVNVETVRYYERRGLVPNPPRRQSGLPCLKDQTGLPYSDRKGPLPFLSYN